MGTLYYGNNLIVSNGTLTVDGGGMLLSWPASGFQRFFRLPPNN